MKHKYIVVESNLYGNKDTARQRQAGLAFET